jgi:hypothetical protein
MSDKIYYVVSDGVGDCGSTKQFDTPPVVDALVARPPLEGRASARP